MIKKNEDFTLDDLFNLQAEFCSVFRNAIRLKILWLLADREISVSEIAERLDVSMSNVSQHLRIMKDRRFVKSRKEGQRIYYRILNQRFILGPSIVREGIMEVYHLDKERLLEALEREK